VGFGYVERREDHTSDAILTLEKRVRNRRDLASVASADGGDQY
jgi:hypothetical protein